MTTTNHWFKSRIKELDATECRRLLHTAKVGRLAFTDDSGPDVLPINFSMDGDDILIATTGYGAIARAATGARVAFEIDELDPYTESGWSVVVRGHAHRVAPFDIPPDGPERPYPWAEGNRSYILRINADSVTGIRLIPA
jgi:hypothetical protein